MDHLAIWRSLFLFSSLAYWPAHLLLFSRLERLGDVSEPSASPSTSPSMSPWEDASAVSVIIPARNEAERIGGLVTALAGLYPPPGEIIVVDDGSEDGTGEIARRAGARLIELSGPPRGWTGKNFACHTGAEAAGGQYLLFLDADVELPDAELIHKLLGRFRIDHPRGGMISLQPHHRMERPYEQLSLFFNLVALAGSRDFGIFRSRRDPSGAFGPLIFTDRKSYRNSGGHRAMAGAVVDDLALCRLYRSAGLGVRNYLGGSSLSFRMYPRGAGQLAEGWTKNMASGAGMAGASVLLLLVFWITGLVNTVLGPVSLLWGWNWFYALFALGGVVLWLVTLSISARRVGTFSPLTVLLFPVPLLFFFFVMVRSIILTRFCHQVRWRGRTIPVGREAGE